ncbi:MAG: hypothetical protein GY906_04660 [bacterium]|nr:hypothetical protein [bacterium]
MININIPRWVAASVSKHMQDSVAGLGLTFFVEGVDVESPEWFNTDSAVLRITGPMIWQRSAETKYKFEVMVMLTDLLESGSNGFENHDRLGVIANALSGDIPIFSYGGDATQVGCLTLNDRGREPLRIVHFGKIDPNSEVVQAAVLANFEMYLDS